MYNLLLLENVLIVCATHLRMKKRDWWPEFLFHKDLLLGFRLMEKVSPAQLGP